MDESGILPQPKTMKGWRNLFVTFAVALAIAAAVYARKGVYPFAALSAILALRCSYNARSAHRASQDATTGVPGTQDDESID